MGGDWRIRRRMGPQVCQIRRSPPIGRRCAFHGADVMKYGVDSRAVHIRDPIHGAFENTPDERALVDSPQYQRLRNVKQLGFADLAFPGATHTRYAHGLGAMAVATRVFDALAPKLE